MKRRVGDLLAVGLLLISFALFFFFLSMENLLIKLPGLIGSITTFLVEFVFLWESWR